MSGNIPRPRLTVDLDHEAKAKMTELFDYGEQRAFFTKVVDQLVEMANMLESPKLLINGVISGEVDMIDLIIKRIKKNAEKTKNS